MYVLSIAEPSFARAVGWVQFTFIANLTVRLIYCILWLEPFWILLVGIPLLLPGRFFPHNFHPFLIITLFCFWPLRWLYYHCFSSKTTSPSLPAFFSMNPLSFSVFTILLWLPINFVASVAHSTSWVAVGYLLLGLTLYIALTHSLPIRYRPELIAGLLLLLGMGLAVVSPPLVAWKSEFRLFYLPLYDRLSAIRFHFGETIHANVLAGILVIILPCLLAITWYHFIEHQSWKSLCYGGISVSILFLLILTQSRAGYLAFTVGVGVILTLFFPKIVYGVPVAIVGVFVIIQNLGLQPILESFSSDGSLGGWDVRGEIWRYSYIAVGDFIYTGIGIGTFTTVMPLLYPIRFNIQELPHAHNLFVQIGLDLGLPGLTAYLASIINLFVMLIVTLRSRYTTQLHRTLTIGATGSLVGMLVHGLLDAVTWGTKLAFMPWILFALITQLFLHTQAAEQNATRSSG